MKKASSLLLVVDASVAHSAGNKEHPLSRCCRESLKSILTICHHVVMTPAIRDEWKRHASLFTRRWLSAMKARRKVENVTPPPINIPNTDSLKLVKKELESLIKDVHLIEGALTADGLILTCDDRIREVWEKCGHVFKTPQVIQWIYPVRDGVNSLSQKASYIKGWKKRKAK